MHVGGVIASLACSQAMCQPPLHAHMPCVRADWASLCGEACVGGGLMPESGGRGGKTLRPV